MEAAGVKLWLSFEILKSDLKQIIDMVRVQGDRQCITVGNKSVWHGNTWMAFFLEDEAANECNDK